MGGRCFGRWCFSAFYDGGVCFRPAQISGAGVFVLYGSGVNDGSGHAVADTELRVGDGPGLKGHILGVVVVLYVWRAGTRHILAEEFHPGVAGGLV